MATVVEGAVIGIDTKTTRIAATVCTHPDEPPKVYVIEIPKKIPFEQKCWRAECFTRELVKQYAKTCPNVFVFIENPLMGRGGIRTTMQLAKIEGSCLSGIASVVGAEGTGSITTYEVYVQSWKVRVVGAGNASKQSVAAWCYTYWRQAYDIIAARSGEKIDEDLIDSAAICFYGMKTIRLSGRMFGRPRNRNGARGYLIRARAQAKKAAMPRDKVIRRKPRPK